MKTSKELKELRGQLYEDLTTLEKGFEGKDPTPEQRSAYEAKLDEIKKSKEDIEFAERAEAAKAEADALKKPEPFFMGKPTEGKTEEVRAQEGFNIARAVGLVTSNKPLDGLEAEMRAEADKELNGFGQRAGAIAVPSWAISMEKRTDIDQTNSAIQKTGLLPYVDALREDALWTKLGVNVLEGLVDDYKIPIVAKQAVAWATAENSAAADGGANFTKDTLAPIRTTGYVDISNRVLLQNGAAAQASIMRDLGRATAQLWNTAMFSTSSVSNSPGALAATSGVGTFTEITPYAANVSIAQDINLAEQVLIDSEAGQGRISVVLATNLLADLRRSAEVASVSPIMTQIGRDKYLLGYPAHFTVAATKSAGVNGHFLMGDFTYVQMGLFGGMNIMIDDKSVALNDQIRLILHRYVDWSLTQGAALVKAVSLVA